MDTLQAALYSRIDNFNLDVAGVQLTFSQRLARENNWSQLFTSRAIDEYKKFTFLAMVAGHPVTPSQQVDAVWHLHLTYSQSYWQDFCPNILGGPLHHEPTQGGTDEADKFREWYGNTLISYETWFDEKPPADIWPDVNKRFRSPKKIDFFMILGSLLLVTNLESENKSAIAIFIGLLVLFNISLMRKSNSKWDMDFDDGDSRGGYVGD